MALDVFESNARLDVDLAEEIRVLV